MPNRDNPSGFIPVFSPTGEIRGELVKLTATNAIIGVNDPLMLTADGSYDRWSAGALAGVALAPSAASSGASILAVTDPNVVFVGQTDDTTGTLTLQTGVNLNADIITGNAVNGRSIFEIDESSGDVAATLPWKVIGIYPGPENEFGQFNKLLLIPNNHVRKGGTGTAGV